MKAVNKVRLIYLPAIVLPIFVMIVSIAGKYINNILLQDIRRHISALPEHPRYGSHGWYFPEVRSSPP